MTNTGPHAVKPLLDEPESRSALVVLWAFVLVPFLALLAAVPMLWGWGLSWIDISILVASYWITGLGVAIGFHRYLTHRSFRAVRPLRIALAVAGSLAFQGPPIQWVADHRRHHAYSDREGDPHSPWRFGGTALGLAKGLFYAHVGWLFKRERSNRERFAPDLLADKDIVRIEKLFPLWMGISLLAPAAVGGLATMSWAGALSGLFWGALVRIALLHHVTWAINSVCHVAGKRPFDSRDKAKNFWPMAIIAFGENWHNSHHTDPTCARHGVLRGQIDPAARTIWIFEKFGWVYDVRWPQHDRFESKSNRRVHFGFATTRRK